MSNTVALAMLAAGTLQHSMLAGLDLIAPRDKGSQAHRTGHKHMAYKRASIKQARKARGRK